VLFNRSDLIRYASDVRFYLALFFLIRLWGITNPPLDGNHGWRQAQTCMVARNMLEVENNPLYPRADQFGGDKSGIFGSEFPLLQEMIAGISLIFGYDHWYGRLINLIITTLGLWFFYLFLRMHTHERIAFYTIILLSVSVWFMFARKVMPDTFSIAICMSGIYAGARYAKENRLWQWLVFVLCITAGGLSKIPATFLVAAIVPFLILRSGSNITRLMLLAGSSLAACAVAWWYFIWNPHLVSTYGANIMFVKSLAEGFHEVILQVPALMKNLFFNGTQSYAFSALVIAGFWFTWRRERHLLLPIVMSLVFLLLYMCKVGGVFPVHNYYMIPFAVVYALLAAITVHHVQSVKYRNIIIALVVAECLVNQYWDLAYPHRRAYKLELESLADQFAPGHSTVAFVSDDNPSEMYFAHRRGWLLWPEEAVKVQKLNELSAKGCKVIFLNRHNYPELQLPLDVLHTDEHYSIYSLNQ
jgi:hypothetical protein